ncbi:MAG TPA: hypothetical protein PKA29_01745 [Candidatus Saccharibacteria bacterium]|nr:hypothetical protein [Candidatus Saccharibacteria bacterium]
MSKQIKVEPIRNQYKFSKKELDIILSNESIAKLTGFLDVLIQMDVAQKQTKSQEDNNESNEDKRTEANSS